MFTQPNLTDHDLELLSAYLDGALPEAERTTLEARLLAEPELRRELERLQQTVSLIRQLPPLKAPRNFTLDEDMVRRPAPILNLLISPVFTAVSAAAATLLIVLGAFLLVQSGTPMSAPSPAVALQRTELSPNQKAAEATPSVSATEATRANGFVQEQASATAAPTRPPVTASPTLTVDEGIGGAQPQAGLENAAPAVQPSAEPGLMLAVPAEGAVEDALPPAPEGTPAPASAADSAASVMAAPTLEIVGQATAAYFAPGAMMQQGETSAAAAEEAQTLAGRAFPTASLSAELESSDVTALAFAITASPTPAPTQLPASTSTVSPTATATLMPTPVPAASFVDGNTAAPLLLAAGLALLILAVSTIILRRRL